MGKKAIVLMNLGSPDSTSTKDLKKYLNEFLMDEQVIDIPSFWRTILVKGVIVPLRAPKSAKKYESIWTDEGSPLIVITQKLAALVEEKNNVATYICMRYGAHSPSEVLQIIRKENPEIEEVVVLPMYPHYAMSSYKTAVEHMERAYRGGGYTFSLKTVPPFYNHAQYIQSLSNSLLPYLEKEYDHILFSYHGIPERHVKKTDPTKSHCAECKNCCEIESKAHKYCYQHQVIQTTKLVAQSLNLPEDKYSLSFQSRLGRDKWLEPFTVNQLKEFPTKGIKKLLIICPAFVSDCLETLEEIQIEGKEDFLQAGGETFKYVPCLNTDEQWIDTIATIINSAS